MPDPIEENASQDAPIGDPADPSSYPPDHPAYMSKEDAVKLRPIIRLVLQNAMNDGFDFQPAFESPTQVTRFFRGHVTGTKMTWDADSTELPPVDLGLGAFGDYALIGIGLEIARELGIYM